MKKADQKPKKVKKQENIGYENTNTRNNQDDQENSQVETTDTGHGEGPKEKKSDSAGIRSESGGKSKAGESGNVERG